MLTLSRAAETGLRADSGAEAVILAMGCRERPRGALNIPGYRPAGIYSAGAAQRLVNMEGYMPGKDVVILGSGDIGLIMARRMTLEGAKVQAVAEVMPYSGGLKRNIVQCLEDFNIPLYLSTTVVDIHGRNAAGGRRPLAQVDGNRRPIPGTGAVHPLRHAAAVGGSAAGKRAEPGRPGVQMDPVTGGAGGGRGPVRPPCPACSPAATCCTSTIWWTSCLRRRPGPGKTPPVYLLEHRREGETVRAGGAETACATPCPSIWTRRHMEDTVTVRFRVGATLSGRRPVRSILDGTAPAPGT